MIESGKWNLPGNKRLSPKKTLIKRKEWNWMRKKNGIALNY
jgi:hypothetical protein